LRQPISSADWKKLGSITGKAFGQPLTEIVPGDAPRRQESRR
jgi:hypothetical protein